MVMVAITVGNPWIFYEISINSFLISQYDIQLFPDMKFVENNGRGGIAFGTCKLL
jgi:hypothetical protein